MKWIGQHIWSFISRFRSDVYLESVDSGTIASGGNLGLDSNNKVVKANTGDALSFDGSTANGVCTYKDADEISVESNLTYDSGIGMLVLENGGLSTFKVNNSATNTIPGMIYLQNKRNGGAGSGSDLVGKIVFEGQNSNSETVGFAAIIADIENVTDTDEAGVMYLQVAASDGSTSTMRPALTATGHGTANKVDVGIGYNTASVTTIAGDLHVTNGGTITSSGYSGQSISAGTLSWNGTSCKVFPNEFMVDDGGGTWRINETGGGVYSGRFSDTSTEAICYFRIPDGKRVTRVIFNTTTTVSNICSVRPLNYTTGQAGTEETFNSNTLATLSTPITGALTTDLLLTFKPASSTTGLYGVLITIVDV